VTASRQLFICLALLLVAANYPQAESDTATEPPGVTPENYEKIEVGMTNQQVVRLLGGPPADYATDAERSSKGFYSQAYLRTKKYGDLWRSTQCRIWVVFDAKDCVKGKLLEETGAAK
jgi:SmpA / OmlA family